jgi:hypothetical protein
MATEDSGTETAESGMAPEDSNGDGRFRHDNRGRRHTATAESDMATEVSGTETAESGMTTADSGTATAESDMATEDSGSTQTEPELPAGEVDISGVWDPIVKRVRKNKVNLFTSFKISNQGTEKVESVTIKFYQSEDNNLDESDYKLEEHVVHNVKEGETIDMDVRIEYVAIGSEDHIIAVIDPDNNIEETDEENNVSISSPIQ